MSAQPELPGLRPNITVSMQEQRVLQSQQTVMESCSTSMPMVLSTDNIIKSLPVSMAVSISDVKSVHTTFASNPDFKAELVVVNSDCSENPKISTAHTEAETKVTYSLSELVMKEKETLFKPEGDDSVFILEPPRGHTQTVRMRSKNFFTVMEEDEDGEEKNTPTDPVNNDPTLQLNVNCPKYTPFFNFGHNLYQIFNSQNRRKLREKMVVVKADEKNDKPENTDSQDMRSPRTSSGNESDPEHFVHLYEKITINRGGMRRNVSQPNLESYNGDEFKQDEGLKVGSSLSQSLPTSPKVSPRFRRRNSASSYDIKKPDPLKPTTTGPGLSFLASVAGELRSHKKRYSEKKVLEAQPDTQVAKANPDVVLDCSSCSIQNKNTEQAVGISEKKGVEIPWQRSKKNTNYRSSTESSPSTSPRNKSVFEEMKASQVQPEGKKKKSLMKSIVDWSTTPQNNPSNINKETNMFSPTSF